MSISILEIKNILSVLIKQAGISEAQLARNINIPRATINRLVSGKTPDPRASTINVIANYFNISVDQLLGKEPLTINNNELIVNKSNSIPIIEWVNTKNWKETINNLKPDNHFEWITIDHATENADFAVKIDGEAMWPLFQKHTVLIISTQKEEQNRDFVLAYLKEEECIVFRQLIIEDQYKFLKPINNIFPVISFNKFDKIIGVVTQTRNYMN